MNNNNNSNNNTEYLADSKYQTSHELIKWIVLPSTSIIIQKQALHVWTTGTIIYRDYNIH